MLVGESGEVCGARTAGQISLGQLGIIKLHPQPDNRQTESFDLFDSWHKQASGKIKKVRHPEDVLSELKDPSSLLK
jgi:hypothetical protein